MNKIYLQRFTLEPSSEVKFEDAQAVHFQKGQQLQTQIHWENKDHTISWDLEVVLT